MQPNNFSNLFSPPTPKVYHLFLSHSWDYGEHRDGLGNLVIRGLPEAHNILDYAATKDDPIHSQSNDDLYLALVGRINQSNVLVFPTGVYGSFSQWMPTELDIALRLGKPILAVEVRGAERHTRLVNAATEVVGWNSASIGAAIRRLHP